jgi:integrase
MEITRQLRLDKLNKKGYAPIQVTICWDGQRLRVASGQRTKPEYWDGNRVRYLKGQPTYYDTINPVLDRITNTAEDAQASADRAEQRLTRETLEQQLAPVLDPAGKRQAPAPADPVAAVWAVRPGEDAARMPLLRLMDRWLTEYSQRIRPRRGRGLAPSTVLRIRLHIRRLADYATARNCALRVEDMDQDFYQDLYRYFIEERGQDVRTLNGYVHHLSVFLRWCEDQELPVNRKYTKWPMLAKTTVVKSLTVNELRRIQQVDFTSEAVRTRLEELRHTSEWLRYVSKVGVKPAHWAKLVEWARDKFLLCAYTGLRISDADRVTWADVDGQILEVEAKKTGIRCYIPFYDDELLQPVALAEKYRQQGHPQLVPRVWAINSFLTCVQDLAGITRLRLTTKIGRKTYVTARLYQGLPARMIMQATGHQTESSFNAYVGVDLQQLLAQFQQHSRGVKAA